MSIAIRMAGFERRDEIEWLYMSGFPKAMDVGKQFDKVAVKKDMFEPFAKHLREQRKKKGLTTTDVAKYFPSKTGGLTGCVSNWENAKNVPTLEQWKILKPLLDLSDEFTPLIERVEAEREKIGEYKYSRKGEGTWDTEVQGGIFKAQERTVDITLPATKLAKKWDGWKVGTLKPAHEPILMFRKPLEKNACYNIEKWGTGALNIDRTRIPYDETSVGVPEKGRFPANCITLEEGQFYSKYFNITPKELSKKASKKDRNSDWQGKPIDLEPKNNMRVNAPRKNEEAKHATKHPNHHPTVKPVPLMEWLIKLVTQPGGIVLDPFCGSGSTLVAAKKNGFNYVGIDLNEEYVEIAKKRLGE